MSQTELFTMPGALKTFQSVMAKNEKSTAVAKLVDDVKKSAVQAAQLIFKSACAEPTEWEGSLPEEIFNSISNSRKVTEVTHPTEEGMIKEVSSASNVENSLSSFLSSKIFRALRLQQTSRAAIYEIFVDFYVDRGI